MDDIEKNRAEYVLRLEQQVQELSRQLAEAKPLADRWTPVAHGELAHDGTARVTLAFGGKRITATVTRDAFTTNTALDLTTSIANTLCESMLVEKIAEVVRPEVERLVQAATAIKGAGKW